ncbi:hypothetical protein F4802DRAFT_302200 [Xylaria palmicola]|nr:hypothetical protein F4802DRAFT_302200 [Xylaria palmicola]
MGMVLYVRRGLSLSSLASLASLSVGVFARSGIWDLVAVGFGGGGGRGRGTGTVEFGVTNGRKVGKGSFCLGG